MRVLVTGGAGYLGSLLSRALLDHGHQVDVLDRLLYGAEPLAALEPRPDFRLIEGDVRNPMRVERLVRRADAVIHLAAIVGDPAANLRPLEAAETNLVATDRIARLCRVHRKKLVFASTCSVYGAQPGNLITEESAVESPVSLYGETKLKAERAIEYEAPPNYLIFRMGTLFGDSPRRRFDLVLNLFCAQALTGQPICVNGGDQFRPFLHVRDAADAYVAAIEQEWEGLLNVAWENLRIRDVACEELQKCIWPPPEVRILGDATDPRDYRVDCTKARELGFRPTRDVQFAVAEFRHALKVGGAVDYLDSKYSNVKALQAAPFAAPGHSMKKLKEIAT